MQRAWRETRWENDWGCRETEREKREREKGGRHLEEDQTGQMSDGKMTREMGGWGLEGRERKVL